MPSHPETIDLQSASPDAQAELAVKMGQALDAGELVVLPTETVYGLCARASNAEAIFQLKGRASDKALPFFVSGPGDVPTFANTLPPRARALMNRYWPGPLTLVVGAGPGVALRCPETEFTRMTIAAAHGPIVATSANKSGEPPATRAEAALSLGPAVRWIVDGGPAQHQEASSIARVDEDGRLHWLRLGAGPKPAEVAAQVPRTILFLCTGNTCRSPMAQYLAGAAFDEALMAPPRFLSAGVSAGRGMPASSGAIQALKELDLDASGHQATLLDPELLAEVDVVLTMGPQHAHHAESMLAELGFHRPVIRLLDPDNAPISDPYGGDLAAYRRARSHIQRSLDQWLTTALDAVPSSA